MGSRLQVAQDRPEVVGRVLEGRAKAEVDLAVADQDGRHRVAHPRVPLAAVQPHVLDLSAHLGRSHSQPQRMPRREVGVHVAIQQSVRAASTLVLIGDGLLDARLRRSRAKLLLERCRAGSGGLHCSILPPLRSSTPLRWRRWWRQHGGGQWWWELLSGLAYKSLQKRGV